ncbi:DUF969 family protein [Streptococcus pneumoniae]|nr:DUF969 family protein [Streptococcus pneumoniae]
MEWIRLIGIAIIVVGFILKFDTIATVVLAGFFSIRLGGHPQFVRPLVQPMGEAAAESQLGRKLTEVEDETIKARAAANENFGNFFAQNTFVGAGGVLLIGGTLDQLGYESNYAGIASTSIIVAVITLIVVGIYNYLFDKKLISKKTRGGEQK